MKLVWTVESKELGRVHFAFEDKSVEALQDKILDKAWEAHWRRDAGFYFGTFYDTTQYFNEDDTIRQMPKVVTLEEWFESKKVKWHFT